MNSQLVIDRDRTDLKFFILFLHLFSCKFFVIYNDETTHLKQEKRAKTQENKSMMV